MKREQNMVTEFMYSASQTVRTTPLLPPIPLDLTERRFCWLFEEVCEIQQAPNIISLADGLADLIYIALGAACELGTTPHEPFKTLTGFLRKCEQSMKVRGHEIYYIPQSIRNKQLCDNYISRLIKLVSKFPAFRDAAILNTSLEAIIETACEFALYLGLPLSAIFDEVHRSNMTKFIDGFRDPLDGKWRKGPLWTPPNLEPIIFEYVKDR